MSQPEAIRLSRILLASGWEPTQQEKIEAAAELRRLHGVNQMLVKAAEMALEALRNTELCNIEQLNVMYALQEALAQPVDAVNMSQEYVDKTAKCEHEPVAWVYNGILHEFDPSEFATSEVKPLYTAPPKREWVGLTAMDWNSIPYTSEFYAGAEWAEAKLKEKNGG